MAEHLRNLCAIIPRHEGFDKVILRLRPHQIPAVAEMITHGSLDASLYGYMCRLLRGDLLRYRPTNGGVESRDLALGADGIAHPFQSEPHIRLAHLLEFSEAKSKWVQLWLPTFSRTPNILPDVLRSLANGLNRQLSLVEHVITGNLPMPIGVAVSTPTYLSPHPYFTSSKPSLLTAMMRERKL